MTGPEFTPPPDTPPSGIPEDQLAAFPPPPDEASQTRKIERPSPLTGLANAWLAVVAVVFFFGQEFIDSDIEFDVSTLGPLLFVPLAALLLIVLGGIGVGLIQWRTTTFIVDHEFRIERRFISSTTTRIDFAKVQSVDIFRPLAARILGLAEVRIDVGGGSPQSLRFLTNARAETLRDHILARMEMEQETLETADPVGGPLDGAPARSGSAPARVMYEASPANIVLGAALSLSIGGLIFAGLWIFGTWLVLKSVPLALWLTMFVVVWQVPKELMMNWGFTISQSGKGLHIQRGLFTRMQMTLRPNRVQAIEIRQPLLMRFAGLHKVRLTVLGNVSVGDEQSNNIDVLIPFGKWDEVRHVIRLVWPQVDPAAIDWVPQHPSGKWVSWFADRWYSVGPDLLAVRKRRLSHVISFVPYARIQGLSIGQGPVARWAGVGAVNAETVPGPVSIAVKFLAQPDARKVFQEVLARSAAARGKRSAEPAFAPSQTWAPPVLDWEPPEPEGHQPR